MTNDNQDALGLACEHGQLARACYVCELEAENDAKDALLRQAVEALEQAKHNTTHGQVAWNCKEATDAIRQHLEGRAS